ncbi:MAG: CHASE2 domain-containing protein [Zoogloeaceae bacterium]|nr:CHASE2 domain-containing protein [Zoogloeaceae bacterium]MCP5255831.1 CHASE2 domain-containing protein [Zoogloeaceae bacterium]MCP5295807.1 CHASE2 domain-containing protein [Zoogloeaceae bacterium]MCW5615476.1 CHASE2 domain-containing protein [Rhodocyclaceae bacterium]
MTHRFDNRAAGAWRWRKRLCRSLLRATVVFMIGATVLNVTGLDKMFGEWSQIIAGHLLKDTYGKKAQKDTVVVLFSEEDLRRLETYFPVPYAVHGDVLNAISLYSPRAVFIDFAFGDEARPDDSRPELLAGVDALTCRGAAADCHPVDVFLAVVGRGCPPAEQTPECGQPQRNRWGLLAELDERLCIAPDGDPGYCRGRGPVPVNVNILPPDAEEGVLNYHAYGSDGADGATCSARGCDVKPPLSPAFALAGVWTPAVSPIEIVWIDRPPAPSRADDMCRPRPLLELLSKGKASVIARCPYTDFLHVSQLLEDSKGELSPRLQGKRVIYGADFRLAGDRLPVALYGELPGAFVHAMALDNLLTFGDGAKRPAPKNDWPLVAMALFVGFVPRSPLRQVNILDRWRVMRLVLFVIVLASLPALFWLASTPQAPVALICMALAYLLIRSFFEPLMLVIGVTSLGAAWVSYCLLNFGPVNIISMIAMFELARLAQAVIDDWHAKASALDADLALDEVPRWVRGFVNLLHRILNTLDSKGDFECKQPVSERSSQCSP